MIVSVKNPLIPVVVTILCLAPFLDKAFHVDDPMFIWPAKQIQKNPADFYGFEANWYGTKLPMAEMNLNPPLASYYIALVASLFGWGEIALHTAFLIPAIAVALGTYYLAKQLCSAPVLAAMAAILTPAFLVSATNIMTDMMMLAFWMWAVILWMRGIRTNQWLSLLAGAVLIGLSGLTKYFGISLLAMLFVYSLVKKRRIGLWTLMLLIPVVFLAAYHWVTVALYGRGFLSGAASFSLMTTQENPTGLFLNVLVSLAFAGGCTATVLFFSPLLWSRRFLLAGVTLVILLTVTLTLVPRIGAFQTHGAAGARWRYLLQFALMAVTGLSILSIACIDLWRCRNAESLLLLLWVAGTFVFACFVYWTVNARAILPMIPAVAILLVRQIQRQGRARQPVRLKRVVWPLIPAAIVAIVVCHADYMWANTTRTAAANICKRFETHKGNLWFQGHWGFQYYMEAADAKALDFKASQLQPGDIVIVPPNNTSVIDIPPRLAYPIEVFKFAPHRWLSIMSIYHGAGFYGAVFGPMPFVAGRVNPQEYHASIVLKRFMIFPPDK